MASPKSARCWCAIYTRQSRATDGDFSSCESQFEACRQFIHAQASQGWLFGGLRYDDEGQSGESLERPGLQRLFADIEAGRIDRLVIHRLDRLSRKVVHFASLLEKLRKRRIGLTIVTQPELGISANDALMFNLLSSFAEFERELIRDSPTHDAAFAATVQDRASVRRRCRSSCAALVGGSGRSRSFAAKVVPSTNAIEK